MGAPSKGEEAKRRIITMRVTNAAYERIQKAAEDNGRSVSQEIESRLELSFQEERIIGGTDTNLLTKVIAGVVGLIELETEHKWTEDRMTWAAVNAAVQRIISWFQPGIDYDIWDRYRDTALMPFMDEVYELDKTTREIEGLQAAYVHYVPLDVRERLDAAKARYPEQLQAVREAAKAVFDGPMKEQAERNREAIKLGRQIAGERQGTRAGSFIVAGVAKMYKATGQFEPLPGLRDPDTITDDELFESVRMLAGEREQDPDISVFHLKRTHEDHDGDDQKA